MSIKHILIAAIVLLMVALAVSTSRLASAEHENEVIALLTYEYGELTVRSEDAIFTTWDRVVYLEGPERRDPIRAVNESKIKLLVPIELYFLSALGAQGWEIDPSTDRLKHDTYLLRRSRQR